RDPAAPAPFESGPRVGSPPPAGRSPGTPPPWGDTGSKHSCGYPPSCKASRPRRQSLLLHVSARARDPCEPSADDRRGSAGVLGTAVGEESVPGVPSRKMAMQGSLFMAWEAFEERFPSVGLTSAGAVLYGELKSRYQEHTGASSKK